LAQLATLQSQLATLEGAAPAVAVTGCTITSFDRNLKQGMTGDDVKCLQIVLNSDAATQVAATGVGSSGNETSYFGPLTKAAVVKFQEKYAADVLAVYGLTSGTGFVGTTTRAKLNSILTAGVPAAEVPAEEVPAEEVPAVAPAAPGLTVALASDTPAAAVIISDGSNNTSGSQALVPFLKVDLTNGDATAVKVTTLKVTRGGISKDSDLFNIYLYEGATRLAEMQSISLGVVTFTNAAGLVTIDAGATKSITVKADLDKDVSSGKTISFSLAAATDITSDASAFNGTFPITGSAMSVATVNDLGYLLIAEQATNASTVDPTTNDFNAFNFTLTAGNQNIDVEYIKFLMVGSVNTADLANLELVDGATVVATIAALPADNTLVFDLSGSPLTINSGITKNMKVRLDVVSGSTRTFQFTIQRSADILAKDKNYNVWVSPVSETTNWTYSVQDSVQTTINPGSLIVSLASDSPSANVALNATNVELAKWNLQAVGEAIKIYYAAMHVELGVGTDADGVDPDNLKNVKMLIDGVQVGSLQSSIADYVATDTNLTVNRIIPAGTTAILTIRADIDTVSPGTDADMEDGNTIKVTLGTYTNGAQRMSSLGYFDFTGTAANTVTVSAAGLSAAKNRSVANITVVKGAQDQTIGAFVITAGAAEGVGVSDLTFEDCKTAAGTAGDQALGSAFQNLELYMGTTKLGQTIVTSTSDAATKTYTFNLSPSLSLAAGQSVALEIKADVVSNATWAASNAVELDSATGVGSTTNQAANIASGALTSAMGQIVTTQTAGALTTSRDASSPKDQQVVAGSTDVTLAVWKFAANANENLTVTRIVVYNAVPASSGDVKNLKLFVAGSQVGSPVAALVSDAATFDNLNISVIKNYYTLVTLKADITGAADFTGNLAITPKIIEPATCTATSTISAKGASSGQYATTSVSGPTNRTAYSSYAYLTKVTVALRETGTVGNPASPSGSKIAGANAEVLRVDLTADAGYDAVLNGVKFTAAAVGTITGTGNLVLWDKDDAVTALKTLKGSVTTAYTGTIAAGAGKALTVTSGDEKSFRIGDVWSYAGATSGATATFTVTTLADATLTGTVGAITGTTTANEDGTLTLVRFLNNRATKVGVVDASATVSAVTLNGTANNETNITFTVTAGHDRYFAIGDVLTYVVTATGVYATCTVDQLTNTAVRCDVTAKSAATVGGAGTLYPQTGLLTIPKGTTKTLILKGDTTGGDKTTGADGFRVDISAIADLNWDDQKAQSITTLTAGLPLTGSTITY